MLHDVLEMDGYESLESIGSGSFGLIRKVRRKSDGKILARKEIDYRKMTTKEKEQLVAEVNILKDLKHPNIVQFLERVIDREHCFIYILMEYCEGGDLASVIKRHKDRAAYIPEDFIWSIMIQLIMALHECHHGTVTNEETQQVTSRPILHRDLKPDNVFLDGKHNVKLGDFGLSRSLTNPQKAFAQTYVGTPFYMSPELIGEFSYNAKSDIWSLGCVIYEMCALEPPFLADTQAQLSARIKDGKTRPLPSLYSPDLESVIKWMLNVEHRYRPTTKDLLADPRVKSRKDALDKKRQSDDMDAKMRELTEREARVAEKEAFLVRCERKWQAAEQTHRERETHLMSMEESCRNKEESLRKTEEKLRNAEEVLRNREASLTGWEQTLIKERQLLEEKHRELLQEQERLHTLASRKSLSLGSSSTESMAVDSKSTYDLPSATATTNSTAMDIASTNGNANKHALFSAIPKTTLPATNSYPTPLFSASANATTKGTVDSTTAPGDVGGTTRAAPRRKTGLNVGRYSLQTTNTYRTKTSGGLNSNGTTAPTSSADTQDKGGLFSGGQTSSNPVITQPRPSSVFASLSSMDNASNASKPFTSQPFTYHGISGKESRLSGRPSLTGNAGSDAPRLRAKPKSASTLVASLSSATLSGAGATAAGATASSNTASNTNNNPFLVADSGKSASSVLSTSAAADQSNITFGDTSTATFYFTPSSTLSTIRPQDQNTDLADVQMGESGTESSSAPSSTRLSSGATPSSSGLLRTGASQTNGVSSSTSSASSGLSTTSAAAASVVTATPQAFTSRRSNTSGITASMGHIRFHQQNSASSTGGSSSSAAANTTTTTTTATNSGSTGHHDSSSQTAASTSAAGTTSGGGGALDINSTTAPIKFHIGSGGGSGNGGTGSGKRNGGSAGRVDGTTPHALGSDRFSRNSTPPPNNSNTHHYHYQQQQQQGHYRGDDEDLRMEWDGDIPSPFIKKTYSRPPLGLGGGGGGGGSGISSSARNH
ncbi:G2-specific serine/threonine protein kinase [Mortierella sp. AD031]|nr:G2-specific serine/threonine protein kinase [Mortierella sp. AD031]